jgi:hypothetical protein
MGLQKRLHMTTYKEKIKMCINTLNSSCKFVCSTIASSKKLFLLVVEKNLVIPIFLVNCKIQLFKKSIRQHIKLPKAQQFNSNMLYIYIVFMSFINTIKLI